jgi:glycosyltransferase involved in cell wall biosynthesis
MRSVATWAAAAFRLWKDVAYRRLDMLYLVCSRSNGGFLRDVPALLVARTGLRVVVHAHGSDIVDLLSRRRISPLARALYRGCEIIVPSTHLVQPVKDITGVEPHLCENYFASSSKFAVSAPSRDDNNLTVLWNSNVMASKGFFDVAEAVKQLRDEGVPVKLISLGVPVGDEEMSSQQATGRLDALVGFDWIDYRGKVDQQTAIALTVDADVVCLPSRYSSESQGIAVIEGMCAGKAVVASDIPALRATLRGYPAHFVPVRSVDAIVEALRELYELKLKDPVAFASSRLAPAAVARERFAATRFDREMAAILDRSGTGETPQPSPAALN